MDPTASLLRELAAEYRARAKCEKVFKHAKAMIEVADEIDANAAELEGKAGLTTTSTNDCIG